MDLFSGGVLNHRVLWASQYFSFKVTQKRLRSVLKLWWMLVANKKGAFFVISQTYPFVWKTNQSTATESLGNGNNTILLKGKGLWKLSQIKYFKTWSYLISHMFCFYSYLNGHLLWIFWRLNYIGKSCILKNFGWLVHKINAWIIQKRDVCSTSLHRNLLLSY